MSRFCGEVGFEQSAEDPPGSGVWDDTPLERVYRGDITRRASSTKMDASVTGDVTFNNTVSIVGDSYALEHYPDMRYLRMDGGVWVITSVELRYPRLLLTLGGVYNGRTP